jgi:hypothetical protein
MEILENTEEEERKRKPVWEKIPKEVVSDGFGLVVELGWRVERELKLAGGKVLEEEEVDWSGQREDAVKKKAGQGDGLVKPVKATKRGVTPLPISKISALHTV